MANTRYLVQRTQPKDRATSHHERVLSAQAWSFLIIEEGGKTHVEGRDKWRSIWLCE